MGNCVCMEGSGEEQRQELFPSSMTDNNGDAFFPASSPSLQDNISCDSFEGGMSGMCIQKQGREVDREEGEMGLYKGNSELESGLHRCRSSKTRMSASSLTLPFDGEEAERKCLQGTFPSLCDHSQTEDLDRKLLVLAEDKLAYEKRSGEGSRREGGKIIAEFGSAALHPSDEEGGATTSGSGSEPPSRSDDCSLPSGCSSASGPSSSGQPLSTTSGSVGNAVLCASLSCLQAPDSALHAGSPFLEERPPVQLEGGVMYAGQWKGDRREGFGRLTRADGSEYVGYFKNSQADGKGVFRHTSGDVYEGEWAHDQACGFGTFVHSDGSSYAGQWLNDMQEGHGVEKWIDGSTFVGTYTASKKQGSGKFVWAEGAIYDGQFYNNEIHGHGRYLWADGREYVGQWKCNHMDGEGQMKWKDGRQYKGQYVGDRKEGFGEFVWPDGRKYVGQWKDGKQHGLGRYSNAKKVEREGEWYFGKRIQRNLQSSSSVGESREQVEEEEYSAQGRRLAVGAEKGAQEMDSRHNLNASETTSQANTNTEPGASTKTEPHKGGAGSSSSTGAAVAIAQQRDGEGVREEGGANSSRRAEVLVTQTTVICDDSSPIEEDLAAATTRRCAGVVEGKALPLDFSIGGVSAANKPSIGGLAATCGTEPKRLSAETSATDANAGYTRQKEDDAQTEARQETVNERGAFSSCPSAQPVLPLSKASRQPLASKDSHREQDPSDDTDEATRPHAQVVKRRSLKDRFSFMKKR